MYRAVLAKTTLMYRQIAKKTAQLLNKVMQRTIRTFHLYNLPREAKWQCSFTNEGCTEQLEQTQIFPIQKSWATQKIL